MAKKEVLYDASVAGGMLQMAEIINDVFDIVGMVRWSSNRYEEYGFQQKFKNPERHMFCGIWYAAWQYYEVPLCITVGDWSPAPSENHNGMKRVIDSRGFKGVSVEDFDGYSTIIFKHEFFNFSDDAKRIADVYKIIRAILQSQTRPA